MKRFCLLMFLLLLVKPNSAQIPTAIDVPYGDHPMQKLDYWEANQPNSPVLIKIHSGNWAGGNKGAHLIPGLFQENGYAIVDINYRLSDDADYPGFPAQSKDLACAVAWAKRNASLIHGDGNKIILLGWSAGGHLAALHGVNFMKDSLLLAGCGTYTDITVQGVISISGIYQFDLIPDPQLLNDLSVMLKENSYWDIAQPAKYAANHFQTRFLLVQGGSDYYAGTQQARAFYDSLQLYGHCAYLKVMENEGHDVLIDDSLFYGTLAWADSVVAGEDMGINCPAVTALFEGREDDIKIYPNPAGEWLNIKITGTGSSRICIYSVTGRCMTEERIKIGSETRINLERLKPGIYFIRVSGNKGKEVMRKFVKE